MARGSPADRGSPRGEGRAGFLAVEALATLAISAAILVGLASLLALMLRAGDKAAARAQGIESGERALAALRRDIGQLKRWRWAGEARRSFIFDGEADRIMFALDGVVVAFQSVPGPRGGRLLRSEAPLAPDAVSRRELRFGPDRAFLDGPEIIRFAYMARGPRGDEVALERWPVAGALPAAIRIERSSAVTGGSVSTLRVPILSDSEPGCAAPQLAFCSRVAQGERAEATAPPAQAGQAPAPGR